MRTCGVALVDSGAFGGGGAGLVAAEQEGEDDEADGHPTELHVDVLVALGRGLHVELVVKAGQGPGAAVGPAEGTAEKAGEGLGLLLEGGTGGGHGVLEVLLVPHGAGGDLGAGDGDEDAAADVADEVDEACDLVGLLAGHADVGGGGDGDEAEGQGEHLDDAQPGGLGEGHLEGGDVGGVAVGECEEGEAEHSEPAGGDLACGPSGDGHDDEQGEASGGEGHAGGGGGPAEELLHELGLQDGGGVEDAADQHHEQAADGEVLVAE